MQSVGHPVMVEAHLAALTSFTGVAASSVLGWGCSQQRYLSVPALIKHFPLGEQGLGKQTLTVKYGVSGD